MGNDPSVTANSAHDKKEQSPGSDSDKKPILQLTQLPGNVTTQHVRQVNPSPTSVGCERHGQYLSLLPFNMSNMGYGSPNLHSHPQPLLPFSPGNYSPGNHLQGHGYLDQATRHFDGHSAAMHYGLPFAPAYAQYTTSQPPIEHGSHYSQYDPCLSMQNMQNMRGGQIPLYQESYYLPPTYTNYGHGTTPAGQLPQNSCALLHSSRRSTTKANKSPVKKETEKRTAEENYDVSIVDGSNPPKPHTSHNPTPLTSSISPKNNKRWPPRKPKQSGHALWVGNLPAEANVMDLKDYFSQDATDDIESVFLISKSNCAFVNYKSAAASAAALTRFHDSRFQGVRLVCRIRKGFAVPGSGISSEISSLPNNEDIVDIPNHENREEADSILSSHERGTRFSDRYFVVKSLTVDDLEFSKQSGIWATQAHNETNLNNAFDTTDNVYLIFSANKSGEYFGYARMLSPIIDNEELSMEVPPRLEREPETDEIKTMSTAASSTAPKGRIIDDSTRGTIFWEVESSEGENDDSHSEKSTDITEETKPEVKYIGKPFRIQWLSTERVPFHLTRGLRNPWNANREVKIARDGTEIEPSVGRKLIQLFSTK